MIELNKDNYDEKVLGYKGISLVDFWSETCEGCLDIIPDLETLEVKYKGRVNFGKVNIKGNRRLAIREKVLGLPSLLIYKNGEKLLSFSKEIDMAEVEEKLKEIVGG
ncbi:MAG: thioredoxin family protein [Spirochaetales bacterium]|nr:thioredoxin family protein [Spirochaetales bacterium]